MPSNTITTANARIKLVSVMHKSLDRIISNEFEFSVTRRMAVIKTIPVSNGQVLRVDLNALIAEVKRASFL